MFEFHRANEWKPETAAHKLAPLMQETWYWEALGDRLSFRPLTEEEAIVVLAEASSAGPAYKSQLAMILDFLALVGLVERENGTVKRSSPGKNDEPKRQERTLPPADITSTPTAPASNTMSISMNLTVSMDVFSTWAGDLEKVRKFFAEWANLVAAKTAIENMVNEKK